LYIRISFDGKRREHEKGREHKKGTAALRRRDHPVAPQRGQTMMPLQVRRKGRTMEKVENLCRTATAQQNFTDTAEDIGSRFGSRLRDSTDVAGRPRSSQ
jgi:hypothetical protein